MRNLVVCLNLDTVKNKNSYQYSSMGAKGFRFSVWCYTPPKVASNGADFGWRVYPKNLFLRFFLLFRFLVAQRSSIHHVELYMGGGSFLFCEFVLSKLLRIPICVVERGSPLLHLDQYGFFARSIRRFVYRFADNVWIRELWMKEKLEALGRSDYFFLNNCIQVPKQSNHAVNKEYDFLWCNSLKHWRNVSWFIDGLKQPTLVEKSSVLIGIIEPNPTVKAAQDYVESANLPNLTALPFGDPENYMMNSRFFVLPADIVYLNFSLLEAMARGVVPIVVRVEGAEEIIEHGRDGLLVDHNAVAFGEAMLAASEMSDEEYEALSIRARNKILEKFSIESWSEELGEFYQEM